MKQPLYQRFVVAGIWVVGGVLLLGAILDALSNANTRVTQSLATWASIGVAVSLAILHVFLKLSPLPWRTSSGIVSLRGIGPKPVAVATGFILLLWAPVLFEPSRNQTPHRVDAAAAQTSSQLIASDTMFFEELWYFSPPPVFDEAFTCAGKLCRVSMITFLRIVNASGHAVILEDIRVRPESKLDIYLQQEHEPVLYQCESVDHLTKMEDAIRDPLPLLSFPLLLPPNTERCVRTHFSLATMRGTHHVAFEEPASSVNPLIGHMFGIRTGQKHTYRYPLLFEFVAQDRAYRFISDPPRVFVGFVIDVAFPEFGAPQSQTASPDQRTSS